MLTKLLKKPTADVCLVLIGALLAGCEMVGKFSYPPPTGTMFQSVDGGAKDKVVVVLPFGDCRGNENSEDGISFYLLPFSPFGWVDHERPEEAETFVTIEKYEAIPFVDFGKAAAQSLNQSKLFKDAHFLRLGEEKEKPDFTLAGRLRETRYAAKVYSYGLSAAGLLFWMFGAPAGASTNTLAFELELRNREGTVLWKYAFSRSIEFKQGPYYRQSEDCQGFSELFLLGMNEALADLATHMKTQPERFR